MTLHATTQRGGAGERRARARRRGLTTLELLIAIAITSITGLAIATVLTATARGLTWSTESRSALQRAHAAYVRIRAYTESSLCLVDHLEDQGFAVWIEDSRPGGKVNLTEYRVFWFEPGDGTLVMERVVFPSTWTPEMVEAEDAAVSVGADFLMRMVEERAQGYTVREAIVDGVEGFGLDWSGATLEGAARFRLRLDVRSGQGVDDVEEILMAFGLSNHRTPSG